ncbi:MAG TPA: STAS domain-containing protein [Candidatus Binatia bacterium]|jgi:anti-sigma B factor antagonist|nr:STAS domain-containing protein [Candidatus Binatia bacterium]
MGISHQELDHNAWLVSVSGRLDQNQTPDLEERLNRLLELGHNRILIDLTEVNYINSGGLRCLVTAWRKARKEGGNVVLTGLRSRVHEVFSMVGFDKVFDVYPSRALALRSWQEKQ